MQTCPPHARAFPSTLLAMVIILCVCACPIVYWAVQAVGLYLQRLGQQYVRTISERVGRSLPQPR